MHKSKTVLLTKTLAIFVITVVATAPTFGQGLGGSMGGMGGMEGWGMGPMPPQLSPLEKLKASLRTAKGDAAQQKILGQIKKVLSDQYDYFLQRNESELQEMERSVKQLRAQLERRKDAKSQLLKLELQRIANEASGLVWPEEDRSQMGMGGYSNGMGGMDGMGMGGGSAMGMGAGMGAANQRLSDPGEEEPAAPLDPETQTQNQLRQIALAALNFESANRHLPGNIRDDNGKPLLSWRVAILPYLGDEENKLYTKFKLDEPWNSEHNIQLLDEMPEALKSINFQSDRKTIFLGFEGKGTMFEPGKEIGFADIQDGSSNTILVAQMNRQSAIEWTKPVDVKFSPGTAVTQLGESANGSVSFVRCDGSSAQVKLDKLDSETLEYLIQRNDKHVVSIDD